MDCRQCKEWMSLCIDGVLDEQEQELFDRHIEECEKCRVEFEEYRYMVSLMQGMDEEELPMGFHERIHQRLKEESKTDEKPLADGHKHAKFIKWFGTIAAVFVLLFSLKMMNKVNIMDEGHTKNDMNMQSIENSGEAPNLEIASVPSIDEAPITADGYAGKKDETRQEELKIQEKSDQRKASNLQITGEQGMAEKQEMAGEQGEDSKYELEFNEATAMQFSLMQDTMKEEETERIETDLVKVRVQDVCITPDTIKLMAVNIGVNVIKSTEDSVILELTDSDQRRILYEELTRLGEVEDVGEQTDSTQVTIVIVQEE